MEIETLLAEQFQGGNFGGAALVRQAGRTLLNRGYGAAHRAERRPNTPKTVFQIASISKQFAAGAILLLQERGTLSVEDRVSTWVPGCPAAWEPMTIHHLLTHSSGIPHYWNDFPDLDLRTPLPMDHLIGRFRRAPLRFPPGTGWYYSSPGYVLAAHIVERASGQSYAPFLRDHIFHPLGMRRTGAGSHAPDPEHHALGYEDDAPVPSLDLDTSGMGAGDVWSTTEDMARWDAALAAPGFLDAASHAAMFTPYFATTDTFAGEAIRYGYAWFITTIEGHRVRYHTGWNDGYRAINVWLPDDAITIVLLANEVREFDAQMMGMRIARTLLGSR